MAVKDFVNRCYRIVSFEKYSIRIRRLKCKGCGKIHRELPDFLLPYKQYLADLIEMDLDDVPEDQVSKQWDMRADAEPSTYVRWRKWFENLPAEKEQYRARGMGWLSTYIRESVNAVCSRDTDFAYRSFDDRDMLSVLSDNSTHRNAQLSPRTRKGGRIRMNTADRSIVLWLLREVLREYFQNNTAYMASMLGYPIKTLEHMLTGQTGHRIVELFEATAKYCVRNRLSLDGILARYPQEQQETISENA